MNHEPVDIFGVMDITDLLDPCILATIFLFFLVVSGFWKIICEFLGEALINYFERRPGERFHPKACFDDENKKEQNELINCTDSKKYFYFSCPTIFDEKNR